MIFSLIIPIFNAEKSLKRCFSSISALIERSDVEIILIDDGSTDESPRLCYEFLGRASNSKYARFPNGGLSAARNRGLVMCSGVYVGFLDSDDECLANGLKTILTILELGVYDIIQFSYCLVRGIGGLRKEHRLSNLTLIGEENVARQLIGVEIFAGKGTSFVWNRIYRRSLIQANNIRFPEREIIDGVLYGGGNEDYRFNLKCAKFARSYLQLDTLGCIYYIGHFSLSKTYLDCAVMDLVATINEKERAMIDYPQLANAYRREHSKWKYKAVFLLHVSLYSNVRMGRRTWAEVPFESRRLVEEVYAGNFFIGLLVRVHSLLYAVLYFIKNSKMRSMHQL